jgi:hypothetical protein
MIGLSAKAESLMPLALTYRLSVPDLDLADLQTGKAGTEIPGKLMEVASEGQIALKGGMLSFQGNLTSPRGTLSDLEYGDLQARCAVRENILTIDNASAQILGSTVETTGQCAFGKVPPEFGLTSKVRGLDLAAFFRSAQKSDPKHIQGRANLVLRLAGSGEKWEQIKSTLQGQGQTEVVEGALLDVNIAEGVLSGITGIPGLTNILSPSIREKYPAVFGTHDTRFNKLTGSATIRDGKVNIDDLQMVAQDWAVHGNGSVDLDLKLDCRGTLSLSPGLSSELAKNVKEVKYIANNKGQLEIPFSLSGTLPEVKPAPDVAYIAGLLKRSAIEKGIEKIKQPELKGILRKLGGTDQK